MSHEMLSLIQEEESVTAEKQLVQTRNHQTTSTPNSNNSNNAETDSQTNYKRKPSTSPEKDKDSKQHKGDE